jgi:hypothetical protein
MINLGASETLIIACVLALILLLAWGFAGKTRNKD